MHGRISGALRRTSDDLRPAGRARRSPRFGPAEQVGREARLLQGRRISTMHNSDPEVVLAAVAAVVAAYTRKPSAADEAALVRAVPTPRVALHRPARTLSSGACAQANGCSTSGSTRSTTATCGSRRRGRRRRRLSADDPAGAPPRDVVHRHRHHPARARDAAREAAALAEHVAPAAHRRDRDRVEGGARREGLPRRLLQLLPSLSLLGLRAHRGAPPARSEPLPLRAETRPRSPPSSPRSSRPSSSP